MTMTMTMTKNNFKIGPSKMRPVLAHVYKIEAFFEKSYGVQYRIVDTTVGANRDLISEF